ncbi:hypothetical protein PpBr36_05462 [Pyricularia pennisetigena]|uniref:hypothetical protein n=1 Tax=Pyricularia pennisetigena TaxID=1578925 RepID=UPI00114DAE33|nr:hypothetical protein PpBr36_05462 [Pyricularia pennisetigena]TLS27450.1 hypothetical protein PpBr36_05462 [Pyricularia pennisetigena]
MRFLTLVRAAAVLAFSSPVLSAPHPNGADVKPQRKSGPCIEEYEQRAISTGFRTWWPLEKKNPCLRKRCAQGGILDNNDPPPATGVHGHAARGLKSRETQTESIRQSRGNRGAGCQRLKQKLNEKGGRAYHKFKNLVGFGGTVSGQGGSADPHRPANLAPIRVPSHEAFSQDLPDFLKSPMAADRLKKDRGYAKNYQRYQRHNYSPGGGGGGNE